MELPPLVVKIIGDSSGVSKTFADVEQSLLRMASTISKQSEIATKEIRTFYSTLASGLGGGGSGFQVIQKQFSEMVRNLFAEAQHLKSLPREIEDTVRKTQQLVANLYNIRQSPALYGSLQSRLGALPSTASEGQIGEVIGRFVTEARTGYIKKSEDFFKANFPGLAAGPGPAGLGLPKFDPQRLLGVSASGFDEDQILRQNIATVRERFANRLRLEQERIAADEAAQIRRNARQGVFGSPEEAEARRRDLEFRRVLRERGVGPSRQIAQLEKDQLAFEGGGESPEAGAKGGFLGRLGGRFLAYHGAVTIGRELTSAVEQYIREVISAHAEMAQAMAQGLHSVAAGFLGGVAKALGSLVSGSPGQAVRGILGGGQEAAGGLISGIQESVSGFIGGSLRQTAAGYQAGANVMGAAGTGLSVAGGSLLFSGAGAPLGVGLIAAGQAVSAIGQATFGRMAQEAQVAGQVLQTVFGAVAKLLTQVVGLVGSFAGGIIEAGMNAERMRTTFEVLVGGGKGSGLFDQMQKLSLSMPYTTKGLMDAAEALLAMGVNADNVVSSLRVLGDVARGDPGRLEHLVRLMEQVEDIGEITQRNLRQLTPLGIRKEDLAKTMGVSETMFDVLLKNKLVGPEVLKETMVRLSGPGGRFFGLGGAQAGGVQGAIQGTMNAAGVAIAGMGEAFNKGAGLAGFFRELTDKITAIIQPLSKIAGQIGETIRGPLQWVADNFTNIAQKFIEIGAEIVGVVGEIMDAIRQALPGIIAGLGASLYNVLDSSAVRGVIGDKPTEQLLGVVDSLTMRALTGLTGKATKGFRPGAPGGLFGIMFSGLQREYGYGEVGPTPDWIDALMGAPNALHAGTLGQGFRLPTGGLLADPAVRGSLRSIIGSPMGMMLAPLLGGFGRGFGSDPDKMIRRLYENMKGFIPPNPPPVGANLIGSAGAAETFARAWSGASGQMGIQDTIELGVQIIGRMEEIETETRDEIKKLPQNFREHAVRFAQMKDMH
jgi:hypothetical protein